MSEDDYYHWVDVGIDLYMDRAMNAEATAARRLELLKDIGTWYSDTANASYRFLPIELVERLEQELKEVTA